MSARYPFGIMGRWLPHLVHLVEITGRDAYGRPLTQTRTPLKARCQVSMIEVLEGGARARVEGVIARTAWDERIVIGAQIDWQGRSYTITQIQASPDVQGAIHSAQIWATRKRGEG